MEGSQVDQSGMCGTNTKPLSLRPFQMAPNLLVSPYASCLPYCQMHIILGAPRNLWIHSQCLNVSLGLNDCIVFLPFHSGLHPFPWQHSKLRLV